jgi:hypothetical protein
MIISHCSIFALLSPPYCTYLPLSSDGKLISPSRASQSAIQVTYHLIRFSVFVDTILFKRNIRICLFPSKYNWLRIYCWVFYFIFIPYQPLSATYDARCTLSQGSGRWCCVPPVTSTHEGLHWASPLRERWANGLQSSCGLHRAKNIWRDLRVFDWPKIPGICLQDMQEATEVHSREAKGFL